MFPSQSNDEMTDTIFKCVQSCRPCEIIAAINTSFEDANKCSIEIYHGK